MFPRVENHVLLSGRAHLVKLLPQSSDEGLIFANVHMERASTIAIWQGAIDSIAQYVQMHNRCVPILAGDWNFVHADNPRIDLRRLEEVSSYDPLATHFERCLPGYIEFEQPAPTRRHVSDGVAVFLSRLDRVYAKVCLVELSGLVVKTVPVGDVMLPTDTSDHVPVSVRISGKRARRPALQAPLSAAVCRIDEFTEEVVRMAQYIRADLSAFVAIDAYKSVFREEARRVAARLESKRRVRAALLAHTALVVLRASRRGALRRSVGEHGRTVTWLPSCIPRGALWLTRPRLHQGAADRDGRAGEQVCSRIGDTGRAEAG